MTIQEQIAERKRALAAFGTMPEQFDAEIAALREAGKLTPFIERGLTNLRDAARQNVRGIERELAELIDVRDKTTFPTTRYEIVYTDDIGQRGTVNLAAHDEDHARRIYLNPVCRTGYQIVSVKPSDDYLKLW